MAETFQIRDVFNPTAVEGMAKRFRKASPTFDSAGFITFINPKLATLTYSERLQLIVKAQEVFLPKDFIKAVKIIVDSLMVPYESDVLENTHDRFIVAAKAAYIGKNGLNHFEVSMNALYEITQRLTAEWGIRPFLINYPNETLAVLRMWAKDKNPHVRRLVSEGSRPYLPWGKKLVQFEKDPYPTLSLLELLKNDTSEYVRRSVANHLNDHAKKHPDLVVETLKRWQSEPLNKNRQRMIKHALRNLLKQGHAGALEILGYKKHVKIELKNFQVDKKVVIGDALNFSFSIQSNSQDKQSLMIDYVIYYRKADGSLSPKVFKLTTKELAVGGEINFAKRQSFKIITTRKFYVGLHQLAIQVNGKEMDKRAFELVVS